MMDIDNSFAALSSCSSFIPAVVSSTPSRGSESASQSKGAVACRGREAIGQGTGKALTL